MSHFNFFIPKVIIINNVSQWIEVHNHNSKVLLRPGAEQFKRMNGCNGLWANAKEDPNFSPRSVIIEPLHVVLTSVALRTNRTSTAQCNQDTPLEREYTLHQ